MKRKCVICWEEPVDPSVHPEWCPTCFRKWLNVNTGTTITAFSATRARRFERARQKRGK